MTDLQFFGVLKAYTEAGADAVHWQAENDGFHLQDVSPPQFNKVFRVAMPQNKQGDTTYCYENTSLRWTGGEQSTVQFMSVITHSEAAAQ